MDLQESFLMLVQTGILMVEQEKQLNMGVEVLHRAMEIPVEMIPNDLAKATWEFLDFFYEPQSTPRPKWFPGFLERGFAIVKGG